ncbi:MAG: RICIN domain-containing protein [Pseudonocardiaceae bacterium]
MYYGLCLDEQEEDVTHDPGTVRLWGCNGSKNQMWAEKIIADHPISIAKNLVSSRSGKCVTYQPDPDSPIISVRLAPCGQEEQAWVRHWNGAAYIFEAAELPGLCLSVTSGPVAEGFTGIRLRRCDPPSPLTDWRPS